MKEIKILGAGISGLTAAITLARSGHKVTVFERADTCGKRFCGDLQGIENWSSEVDAIKELESIGIKPAFNKKPFDRIKLTNGDLSADVTLSKPLFYVVKRGPMSGSLDSSLMQQALDAGVAIRFNSGIAENDADIIATGPSYQRNIPAMVKGIVFETNMEDIAVALLNPGAAYRGYSYLIVVDGYGCMCTTASTNKQESVTAAWNQTLDTFKRMFNPEMRNPANVTGVGCFSLERTLVKDGKAFVGEAAGIQDFLWGFGIRSAIVSGHLAARSIAENLDYRALVGGRLNKYMSSSLVNRFVWEKLSEGNYERIIKRAAKERDCYAFIQKNYSFTTMQRLIYPFAKMSLNRAYPKLAV